jgi:uroporphyrinogen decarboxylase
VKTTPSRTLHRTGTDGPHFVMDSSAMTPRQRLLCALDGGKPDRLPATTHHLMPSFLNGRLGGIAEREFFDRFRLDGIRWAVHHRPDAAKGEYADPRQGTPGFLEARRVCTDGWRVECEELPGSNPPTTRCRFVTPKGTLEMALQSDGHTTWVKEPPIKNKTDIDLIGRYVTAPKCDAEAVNREAETLGTWGILRGHICCFDVFGQPGCWQDAACLVGVERLIFESYDDPSWVHELLSILQQRKLEFTRSLTGAKYDLLELGGGSASSTVISPAIFDKFVAPYDAPIIEAAHQAGQRIVYHTCGGMMPILERIAAMNPDAMETFTPRGMGGDADLAEARRRLGGRMCMIGGLDQSRFFVGCPPDETRAEVRRCFEAAGRNGAYVLCPSDHFFDADPELLHAFADEAARCVYED